MLVVIVANFDVTRFNTFLPIRYIRVEGDIWNLDADEFRRALLIRVQAGGYFSIDLEGIEAAVREFAWIDDVRVARIWPDTLSLWVAEQQPAARWGEDSLLNVRGERFAPRNAAFLDHLPLLSGPPGQEKQVLGMLRAMNERLQPRHLRVEALQLSKRRAWKARLKGGTEIVFGKQDPLVAVDRLLSLLPQLGEERIQAIQKVDLRYPNGFSVIWKPEALLPLEPLSRGSVPVRSDWERTYTTTWMENSLRHG